MPPRPSSHNKPSSRRVISKSPNLFGIPVESSTRQSPLAATGASENARRPFSKRQTGQAPSGASAGISKPHLGQDLSALVIIGGSHVHSHSLLRKILAEVTCELQQLNREALLRWPSIALTHDFRHHNLQ